MDASSGSASPRSHLRSWLGNVLAALCGVAATLLIFELGVRVFADTEQGGPIAIGDVDLSTRIAFFPDRQRRYQTDEFSYTIETNRFGRRDREWSDAEIADQGNVLFVGDSFVLGASVEDAHSLPTQLEAWTQSRGRRREVFNFGMPATGLPQYIELLDDALRIGIQARTVLLGIFVGNDFDPASLEPVDRPPPASPAPSRFTPHSALLDFLRLRIAGSERIGGWILRLDDLLGTRFYNTTGSYIYLRNPPPEKAGVVERILDVLGEFGELCRRHQRELYVVVFPSKIQVENRESLTSSVYDAERPNRLLAEYCASHGLRCFDELPALSETYARERRPLYFPRDRHLNEAGTRVAAESLSAWLERVHALEPE